MTQDQEVPARSKQGLAILEHAFSDGGRVLEFSNSGKERTVLDVTDHHNELQRFYDQEHDTHDPESDAEQSDE